METHEKNIDEKKGQNHVENIMEHWLNIMAKHKPW